MGKRCLLGTATGLLIAVCLFSSYHVIVGPNFEAALDNTIHIYAEAGWQGSGFWLAPNIIVTAKHVVENAGFLKITDREGNEAWSDEVYMDEDMDCAIIVVRMANHSYLKAANSDKVKRLDECYILGHPFGEFRWSITKGIISNIDVDFSDDFFGTDLMLQADAASYPGNSGGPVLNANGRVIGILVGGIIGSDNMSFITPINHALELMKEIK